MSCFHSQIVLLFSLVEVFWAKCFCLIKFFFFKTEVSMNLVLNLLNCFAIQTILMIHLKVKSRACYVTEECELFNGSFNSGESLLNQVKIKCISYRQML